MASLPYDPNKYGKNTMGSGSGPIPPFRNWIIKIINNYSNLTKFLIL